VEVRTIGVIGARAPGWQLAAFALRAGYSVILEDVSPEMLTEGENAIAQWAGAHWEAARPRLTTSRSVEDVARTADFLIEALPEELEAKLEIFTIFDKFAKPAVVLATTSLETTVTDLADMTYRRDECIALRLLGVSQEGVPSLEILRGKETSDSTVEICKGVGARMGARMLIATQKEQAQ
jgi:3-hydroxybutyryl-CoA dehydrogenase